jgi:hypothetical protein
MRKGEKCSEEMKKKVSRSGKEHWNFGKHHSEETRKKMSLSQKGKPKSEETKKKISDTWDDIRKRKFSESQIGEKNLMFGKPKSEEWKRKQSEFMKGRFSGENHPMYGVHRCGKDAPNFGKKASDETKRKQSDARRGKYLNINSPNWKFDKTDEERLDDRSYPKYKEWRNAVYEKDKYTCQCCNYSGKNLNAHHIENYSNKKELRIEVSNGITLCKQCHKDFHHQYSKINNNGAQLQEFLKNNKSEVIKNAEHHGE